MVHVEGTTGCLKANQTWLCCRQCVSGEHLTLLPTFSYC